MHYTPKRNLCFLSFRDKNISLLLKGDNLEMCATTCIDFFSLKFCDRLIRCPLVSHKIKYSLYAVLQVFFWLFGLLFKSIAHYGADLRTKTALKQYELQIQCTYLSVNRCTLVYKSYIIHKIRFPMLWNLCMMLKFQISMLL